MKEADIRREVYHMLHKDLGLWPITQTDLNAPFDIATVRRLLVTLIGMTKKYLHIQGVVFALKAVLDKAVARPPKGRPDILVLNTHGVSAVIEVKALNLLQQRSFAFNSVTPEQHKWLDWWAADLGLGYLAIGTVGIRPRRLWLVDWRCWQTVTRQVGEIQDSLPYIAGKGFRKELQELGWDMDRLLEQFELTRKTGGWVLPPDHSLLRLTED